MRRTIAVAVLMSLSIVAQGQTAPVRVIVSEIKDNRTTGQFFANCELKLSLVGDALANIRGVRALEITKAVDDTGRSLISSDSESKKTPFSFEKAQNSSGQMQKTLTLANPSRRASVIKEIRGSIELFAPAKDPKSVVTIKNVFGLEGKSVPTLMAQKIDLRVLTKTQMEALKKLQTQTSQGPGASPAAALADAVGETLRQMFSGFLSMSDSDIAFVWSDPNDTIVDFELQDAAGKPLKSGSRMSSGKSYTISYQQKPASDAQLVVYLATPSSITKVPLVLNDVVLP